MKTLTKNPVEDLKHLLGPDQVMTAEEAGKAYTHDWSKLRYATPLVVVKCRSTEDVVAVIQYANETNIPVNPRAHAHSQNNSAISDGGILLDTTEMNTIHEIDADALTATCDAGVVWQDLVQKALAMGLVPPVLTTNLGVTLGGTISVGGLGVATFRYGSQADTAIELEVVTGAGDVKVCSATQNKDLFDLVRAGLGQFGIITKATVKLRTCKPNVRKYYLLYEDLGQLMKDCEALMDLENSPFTTIEALCSPSMQGTKKIGEGLELGVGVQFFAYWLFPLHLTVEVDDDEVVDDDAMLAGLKFHKHLHTEVLSQNDNLNRAQPKFDLMKRSGAWEQPHPWMDTIVPWNISQVFIEQMLEAFPPNALGPLGQILFWPSRTDTSNLPMLPTPSSEFVVGLGILATVPEFAKEVIAKRIGQVSKFSEQIGSKRYLSGIITYETTEEWQSHYGDVWPAIVEGKQTYDPNRILSPGLIQYE